MITTKQKVGLGSLITLAGAVWAPQILEMVQARTNAQVGVMSGPDEAEMLAIEQTVTGMPMGPGGLPGAPAAQATTPVSPAPTGTADSQAPPVGSMGSGLGAPAGSSAVMQEVLRTLGRSHAFGLAPTETTIFEEDAEASPSEEAELESPPAIFGFLEEQPLRGTIVGESLSIALIGKQRVRLGEIIPGTAATVTEIHRGRVVLEEGGMTLEVELAPLETSEELMRARATAQANSPVDGPTEGDPAQGASSSNSSDASAATASPPQAGGAGETADSIPQGDF